MNTCNFQRFQETLILSTKPQWAIKQASMLLGNVTTRMCTFIRTTEDGHEFSCIEFQPWFAILTLLFIYLPSLFKILSVSLLALFLRGWIILVVLATITLVFVTTWRLPRCEDNFYHFIDCSVLKAGWHWVVSRRGARMLLSTDYGPPCSSQPYTVSSSASYWSSAMWTQTLYTSTLLEDPGST